MLCVGGDPRNQGNQGGATRIEKLVEVAEYEKFPLKWNLPESAIDIPQISNILQYMWQDMAVFYFFAF